MKAGEGRAQKRMVQKSPEKRVFDKNGGIYVCGVGCFFFASLSRLPLREVGVQYSVEGLDDGTGRGASGTASRNHSGAGKGWQRLNNHRGKKRRGLVEGRKKKTTGDRADLSSVAFSGAFCGWQGFLSRFATTKRISRGGHGAAPLGQRF